MAPHQWMVPTIWTVAVARVVMTAPRDRAASIDNEVGS